jgi:hypothetical protein
MDLFKAIRELHEEKKRLDGMIASLEAIIGEQERKTPAVRRRGRKSMSAEERMEVSKRMQAYWAKRRQQAQ